MVLGFKANINQDSHRIFLTRLVNFRVNFYGIQNKQDRFEYNFVFKSEYDYTQALRVNKVMADQYNDIPQLGQ